METTLASHEEVAHKMGKEEVAELVRERLDIGGEMDAIDNLEGALIDLKRTGADAVCVATVERVQKQIADLCKQLSL